MDPKEKDSKIIQAMKRAPDYINKWRDRKEQLKQKRLERLKEREKEKEKIKRDAQIMKNKQAALENLQTLRLQPCNSVEAVSKMMKNCKSENEKESALKAQITYFRHVISPPNIDHKLFYFSKDKKKFKIDQLSTNLKSIITHKNHVLAEFIENEQAYVSAEQRKQLVKQKQIELETQFNKSVSNHNRTDMTETNAIATDVVEE